MGVRGPDEDLRGAGVRRWGGPSRIEGGTLAMKWGHSRNEAGEKECVGKNNKYIQVRAFCSVGHPWGS